MNLQKGRLLCIGALIWLALAGLALLFLGVLPRTVIAWLLVFGLGPVILLVLDAAGEVVGNAIRELPGFRHADAAIERRTGHQQISGTRIAYYLVRLLVVLMPVLLVFWWLDETTSKMAPAGLMEWWNKNFN
jgi:hypothetical protein